MENLPDRPDAAQSSVPPPAPAAEDQGAEKSQPRPIDPQRLLRIAGVTREVLEEARRFRPEHGAVDHLKRVHGRICHELENALPPELYRELDELTPEIKSETLEELSLAHAEILGWLEGLFQGTQLAIQFQAARAFQEQARRGLPPGDGSATDVPDGRYL